MTGNSTELTKNIRKILDSQYFAGLASVGQGQPYINLVAFAYTDDLKQICFATKRNTRKYQNIRTNGGVSLLVDTRTNQPSDIGKSVAVTIIGSAAEGTDDNRIQNIFLARHPRLQQFVNDPETALIIVSVHEYIIAGFEKTQRLVLNATN